MNEPTPKTDEASASQEPQFKPMDVAPAEEKSAEGKPAKAKAKAKTAKAAAPAKAKAATAPAPAPAPASAPEPAAPAAAPAAAAPAAAPATASFDQLAGVVLDAADLANKSAHSAATVSTELRQSQEALRVVQQAAQRQARILLFTASGIMTFCMIFFLIIGVRMNSRINQLDATIEAVGKRVVDLNAGVESLEAVKASVTELTGQVNTLAQTTSKVTGRLEESVRQQEALAQQIPQKTAQQVSAASGNLARQVEGINSRLQAQSTAVQNLGKEVQTLRGAVGNVDRLNRDVQSLVTLQRERYLETLQRNQAPPERDRNLQYPRQPAPASPNAQPAANNGQIVVVPKPQN